MHGPGGADIHREIDRARLLHEQCGAELMADSGVLELMEKYRDAIEKTRVTMQAMGIDRECALCATDVPGGCCFPGITDGYDYLLLLVNLLYGYPLPDTAEFDECCMFLGEKGCKLLARYYYCVQFLCPRLHGILDPADDKALVLLVSDEVHAGWELERFLRTWLRNGGHASNR